MSNPNVQPDGNIRQGIQSTHEWKLIRDLSQLSDFFKPVLEPNIVSSLDCKLHTKIENLDLAVSETLKGNNFEILLQCDREFPDQDYPEDSEIIRKAIDLLHNLCSLLEPRANISLISPVSRAYQHERGIPFPNLTGLVDHLTNRLRNSTGDAKLDEFVLLPSPGSATRPFLFNISDDTDRAIAFCNLRDSKQKLPRKDVLRLMRKDVKAMTAHFREFNRFVFNLTRQSEESSSRQHSVSLAALQSFWRKASSTFDSSFSQFARCGKSHENSDHRILLKMPYIDDEFRLQLSDDGNDIPLWLFYKTCQVKEWHPAGVNFLPPGRLEYEHSQLCGALLEASCNNTDLQLYISKWATPVETTETPLYTPSDFEHKGTKTYNTHPRAQPDNSILGLIRSEYFGTHDSYRLLERTNYKSSVFKLDRRKSLAIKAVLGLMLSMESAGSICTWDPERMYSFSSVPESNEKDFPLYVSIAHSQKSKGIINQEGPFLTHWKDSLLADPLKRLDPIPPFIYLAKFLMQIAKGETLDGINISKNIDKARQQIDKYINRCLENFSSRDSESSEAMPFMLAARACLEFHSTYRKHAQMAQADHYILRAWRLLFENVISQIDRRFTLADSQSDWVGEESLRLHGTPIDDAVVSASQTSVDASSGAWSIVLFDGETVSATSDVLPGTIKSAQTFLDSLDAFNNSCTQSKVAIQRTIKKGVESPRRVRIAVLDTGVDFSHPFLRAVKKMGRIKEEWCRSWVGGEHNFHDEDVGLHGSNCAYLIHRAAPEVDIYIARVCTGSVIQLDAAANIEKAIKHAVKKWKVDIISISLGLRPVSDGRVCTEVDYLRDQQSYVKICEGIGNAIRLASVTSIIFAAASNDGANKGRAFPASLDPTNLICVHASDGLGEASGMNPPPESGSNNIMTLGMSVELYNRCPPDNYKQRYEMKYKSGTSFATPVAAGIAGTVLDLALRTHSIKAGTRKQLKTLNGMALCMSKRLATPKNGYLFVAPWLHWPRNWHLKDEADRATLMGMVNELFSK